MVGKGLKHNHPDALTADPCTSTPVCTPSISIADHFSSIRPCTPTALVVEPVTPAVTEATPQSRDSSLNSSGETSSIVAKFLPSLPHTSAGGNQKKPVARVLTSAQFMAQLKEKQEKKQKEAEEKEQRKKEREEKKQRKEEEKKRKAEERARKAEEKAKMNKEKAKRAAERSQTARGKKRGRGTNKASTTTRGATDQQQMDTVRDQPRSKTVRLGDLNESFDTEHCCACLGSYEDDVGTGREWLECGCRRWIHEECVEDVREDDQGRDRICPLCLSV